LPVLTLFVSIFVVFVAFPTLVLPTIRVHGC
jgi:hypothetical protein